ncbi:hypothetical protein KIPB_013188, partial [Kipferlia bialata]|eukprot:g13188.t1
MHRCSVYLLGCLALFAWCGCAPLVRLDPQHMEMYTQGK